MATVSFSLQRSSRPLAGFQEVASRRRERERKREERRENREKEQKGKMKKMKRNTPPK